MTSDIKQVKGFFLFSCLFFYNSFLYLKKAFYGDVNYEKKSNDGNNGAFPVAPLYGLHHD